MKKWGAILLVAGVVIVAYLFGNKEYSPKEGGPAYQSVEDLLSIQTTAEGTTQSEYEIKNGEVYFSGNLLQLKELDKESFKPAPELCPACARDKNYLYVSGLPLPKIDVRTFRAIRRYPTDYPPRYFADKNSVYTYSRKNEVDDTYSMRPLKGVDPATFEIISDYYVKDKNQVFFGGKLVQDADPATFNLLIERQYREYYRDRNHVFYEGKMLADSDPDTFYVITQTGYGYSKDKNHVYREKELISGADPNSFELFGSDYGKDNQHVYFQGKLLEGADPKSFELISAASIGKDAHNLYVYSRKVEGVDLATFQPTKFSEADVYFGSFYKDAYAVYMLRCSRYCEDGTLFRIPDADPKTFTTVDRTYAKDASHVYYSGTILIPGADPKTFEPLGYVYAKDKAHIFWETRIIPDADPNSFEFINIRWDSPGPYLKSGNFVFHTDKKIVDADPATIHLIETGTYIADSRNIYLGAEKIPGADPASFKVIKDNYAKDDNHVYVSGKLIPDADPKTFELFGQYSGYARDAKYVYINDKKIPGADGATYRSLINQYGVDTKNVYYKDKIVKGADPATFKVISNSYAIDKSRVYHLDSVVPNADPIEFIVPAEDFSESHG